MIVSLNHFQDEKEDSSTEKKEKATTSKEAEKKDDKKDEKSKVSKNMFNDDEKRGNCALVLVTLNINEWPLLATFMKIAAHSV